MAFRLVAQLVGFFIAESSDFWQNKIMKKINQKIYHFPVIIEKDEEGYYLGKIPALRSCYTQAKTLPELYKRLEEVAGLCLEVEKEIFKTEIEQNQFIGLQQLEFSC